MKVVVTGSYRLHESQHGFAPGRWEDLKRGARALGRGLAKNGHTLLLSWSRNNLLSQLGVKQGRRRHPKSHPYWETAEYHALLGYIAQTGRASKSKRFAVIVIVSGGDPDFPGAGPFPRASVLTADGFADYDGDQRAAEAFDDREWIDLAPHVRSGMVHLDDRGDISSEMRQEMLVGAMGEADAIIVLGGGKATFSALAQADDVRNKVVWVSPFCAGGALCKAEADAAAGLPNLGAAMRKLAGAPERPLPHVAAAVANHLASLAVAERAPRIVVITMREDEYTGVYRHLGHRGEWRGANRTFQTGVLNHISRTPIRIGVVKASEQGNPDAQAVTSAVIADAHPDLIVVCGIAGEIATKDFTLGDVIVSNRIHYFTANAIRDNAPPELSNQGGPLTEEVKDLIARIPALVDDGRLGRWNHDSIIGEAQPGVRVKRGTFPGGRAIREAFEAHFRPVDVRSSEYRRVPPHPKVLSRGVGGNGDLIKSVGQVNGWRKAARDLGAIEMESGGAYRASRTKQRNYNFLTIRGISDIIGLKRDDAWTRYAALVAGSFCCSFLRSLPDSYAGLR